MSTIERLESNVRSYCRSFPVVFAEAQGATLRDTSGREYLDFFAGAGVLNYGHNPPELRGALLDYVERGGITHALDMTTEAKIGFLDALERFVLEPRGLHYKVMFPGPTGTNAVEAALKLARKVTGREAVVSFTNAFHGMTLGALSVTGNAEKRAGAGVPLQHTIRAPFDGYLGEGVDTLAYVETLLSDGSSGIDAPAAFLVETVQAEGGVHVASADWLRRLEGLARRHGALLIIDDIQVGCGRTGPFFSFERAGITPDIVCLSKALSGYGLPLSIVLLRPDHDVFEPGEHNGTFHGHNPAFVTARMALETYWQDSTLERSTAIKGARVQETLLNLARRVDAEVRGLGLIAGLAFDNPAVAPRASQLAFERGLVIETAGPDGEVLKLLPPLVVTDAELGRGLEIVEAAVLEAVDESASSPVNGRSWAAEASA